MHTKCRNSDLAGTTLDKYFTCYWNVLPLWSRATMPFFLFLAQAIKVDIQYRYFLWKVVQWKNKKMRLESFANWTIQIECRWTKYRICGILVLRPLRWLVGGLQKGLFSVIMESLNLKIVDTFVFACSLLSVCVSE